MFAEVVEKICDSPVSHLQIKNQFYYQLARENYAKRHPEAITRLLLHLLSNTSESFLLGEVEKLVRDLINSTAAPRRELEHICEQLSRLGSSNAADLKKLVEERYD